MKFIWFLKSIAITTGTLFISQKFSSVISRDLEEIANRERIVNVIPYYSLLYIYYPAKFLFRKVMGGMGLA